MKTTCPAETILSKPFLRPTSGGGTSPRCPTFGASSAAPSYSTDESARRSHRHGFYAAKTILLCGFFCLLLAATQSLAGPVAPTPPDVLLAAAPSVPAEWKKVISRAQSVISGSGVPVSIATQVYEVEIPVKDAAPKKVRVTINLQDQGGDFALQENAFGDAAKIVSLAGHKAAVLPMGESSTLLQINIPPRLGMSITVQGLSNDEALELFKQVDPTAFFALSKRLSEKQYRGSQFSLAVVDEMNPKRNTKYQQGLVEADPQKPDQVPPR